MSSENFANFATTSLVTSPLSVSATSFAVTSGQGTLFPSRNFLVTIDSEVLFISLRVGDTFTVGTRGFDGTTAARHSAGVTVQLDICAYNLTHLWQNVADTFMPLVPPIQTGGSASAFDNEFEAPSTWTLYPSLPPSGTLFDAGISLKSQLLLSRGSGDNTLYTAYIPYAQATAASFTIKLSHSGSLLRTSTADQAQLDFFVSDQSNPSASPDSGNRFKLQHVIGSQIATGNQAPLTDCFVRGIIDTSGSPSFSGPSVPVSPGMALYLRIIFDGISTYSAYFGDGLTYWALTSAPGLSFAPQSVGVSLHTYNPSGQWVSQTAAIDFLRYDSSTPPVGAFG